MTDRQEPLTPEGLARCCYSASGAYSPCTFPDGHITGHSWELDHVLRILNDSGSYESMEAVADAVLSRQEAADTSALRAAALSIKADHDANGHREPCALCDALSPWPSRRRVIKTQEPTPDERPLDVERLARALWAWGFDATGPVIRDDVKEPTDGQRRMARKLAAEYARLSAAGE